MHFQELQSMWKPWGILGLTGCSRAGSSVCTCIESITENQVILILALCIPLFGLCDSFAMHTLPIVDECRNGLLLGFFRIYMIQIYVYCIQYEPLPRFTHSSDCRIFTKNWTIHTVSFFLRLTPDETLVIWEDICTLHHLLVCTCLYKFDGKNSNLLVFVSNLWIWRFHLVGVWVRSIRFVPTMVWVAKFCGAWRAWCHMYLWNAAPGWTKTRCLRSVSRKNGSWQGFWIYAPEICV